MCSSSSEPLASKNGSVSSRMISMRFGENTACAMIQKATLDIFVFMLQKVDQDKPMEPYESNGNSPPIEKQHL